MWRTFQMVEIFKYTVLITLRYKNINFLQIACVTTPIGGGAVRYDLIQSLWFECDEASFWMSESSWRDQNSM